MGTFLVFSTGFGVKRQMWKHLGTCISKKGGTEESWFLGHPFAVIFVKMSVEDFCKVEAQRPRVWLVSSGEQDFPKLGAEFR